MNLKRRDALVAMAASGVAIVLPGCASPRPTSGALTDDQMRAMLRLNGMDLAPGEGPRVLASFTGNRYAAAVDPAIQPNCDFDPDVS
jgi:hypothetical protein